jgi:hypothetical protein
MHNVRPRPNLPNVYVGVFTTHLKWFLAYLPPFLRRRCRRDRKDARHTWEMHVIVRLVQNRAGMPMAGLLSAKYYFYSDLRIGHGLIQRRRSFRCQRSCGVLSRPGGNMPMKVGSKWEYRGDHAQARRVPYGMVERAFKCKNTSRWQVSDHEKQRQGRFPFGFA